MRMERKVSCAWKLSKWDKDFFKGMKVCNERGCGEKINRNASQW